MPWSRLIRAALYSGVTTIPFGLSNAEVIGNVTGLRIDNRSLLMLSSIYLALVYLAAYRRLAPDINAERAANARQAYLDLVLDTAIQKWRRDAGTNLQLRVNVMRPSQSWGRRRLDVVYDYLRSTTSPDSGCSWPRGQGLCWKAFLSGVCEFRRFHQPEDHGEFCNSQHLLKRIGRLKAVFSLPAWGGAVTMKAGEPRTSEATIVVNLDTESDETADWLSRLADEYQSGAHGAAESLKMLCEYAGHHF